MSALLDLSEQTEETHGITCRFDCDEVVTVLDNFTATRIYRIAKEAVHNAVKHAQPGEIVIKLSNERSLTLQVRDNGCGMTAGLKNKGNGTRIMRHRCEVIGGGFGIRSGKNGGTVVTCSIEKKYTQDRLVTCQTSQLAR